MSLWSIALIGFLFSWFLGGLTVIILIRRIARKNAQMQRFISDLYHTELLPEICRVEGLNNLVLMEAKVGNLSFIHMYAELALKEIREHKRKVTETIQRHQKL